MSAFGENKYISFIPGSLTNALYSCFAGSNTKNGILCSFQREDVIWCMVFVLPEPGTPETKACLGNSESGKNTSYPFLSFPRNSDPSLPTAIGAVSFDICTISPSYNAGNLKKGATSSRENKVGR